MVHHRFSQILSGKPYEYGQQWQPESLLIGNRKRNTKNTATGNADSKPLNAEVAQNSESTDSIWGVSGSAKNSGRRAKSTDRTGIESLVELGESRSDETDASTAKPEHGNG